MRIVPIVEGQGEVEAVPVLLRRFAAALGVNVDVARPIRQPDCAATLGPQLLAWSRAERADRRIAVVLAQREFEAWFLASTTSLIERGKLLATVEAPADPESVADPKNRLSEAMGRRYGETIDQPALAAIFDLVAARRCASFDKLARDVEAMLTPRANG